MSERRDLIREPRPGQRLSIIPAGIIWDHRDGMLTKTDLMVAAVLGTFSRSGGLIKSTRQELIAKRAGLTRETVNRSMSRLKDRGWIDVVLTNSKTGVKTYQLRLDVIDPDWLSEPDEQDDEGEKSDPVTAASQGSRWDASVTGGCDVSGHTPCDPCDHSRYEDSFSKISPLPPSASQQESAKPPSTSAMDQPADSEAPGGFAACSAGSEVGDSSDDDHPAPQPLNADWRKRVRAQLPEEEYRAMFASTRASRDGRVLIAPTLIKARELVQRYRSLIRQIGFKAVLADHERVAVELDAPREGGHLKV